jgi:hypothetical protein
MVNKIEESGEKWKETFYQVAWNFVNDRLVRSVVYY